MKTLEDEASIISVSTEQFQWKVFAHFTLNETGKTLNGLNGSQGGGLGILLMLSAVTDISRWDPPPGPWVSVLSDTAELHNFIHIASRGINDPSELDIIFISFSLMQTNLCVTNIKFNWSSNKSLFVEYCYQQNCASYTANNKL